MNCRPGKREGRSPTSNQVQIVESPHRLPLFRLLHSDEDDAQLGFQYIGRALVGETKEQRLLAVAHRNDRIFTENHARRGAGKLRKEEGRPHCKSGEAQKRFKRRDGVSVHALGRHLPVAHRRESLRTEEKRVDEGMGARIGNRAAMQEVKAGKKNVCNNVENQHDREQDSPSANEKQMIEIVQATHTFFLLHRCFPGKALKETLVGMKQFDRKFGVDFLQNTPTTPGVYRIYDSEGQLIYVGKAKNLRRRLGQYRNARRLKRHRKMRAIMGEASRIQYEVRSTDLDACLEELRLIQSSRPKWNVAGAFAFLYPMLGIRVEPSRTCFCLTTLPDKFPGYSLYGAYRSRHLTGDAFFALMRLLRYIAHPVSAKESATLERAEYSYVFGFRRVPEHWPPLWGKFFQGSSPEALEELVLRLVENAGARAKATDVQEHINSLRRFWRHEARVLAKAIQGTGYADYPVTQQERDALFLRYRLGDQKSGPLSHS